MEKDVPYIVYESALTRMERLNKRLFIGLILTVALLFVSNVLWLYAWNQYEYTSETVTYSQDGQGVNVMGDGNVTETNNPANAEN